MPKLGGFEKILRVGEGRRLKRLAEQAAYIASLEPEFEKLSDDELAGKTVEFRQRLENGEDSRGRSSSRPTPPSARRSSARVGDQRIFDVQLMGGIVLHEGDIAEMKTGEGKTFVAAQPLYLNALPRQGRPPRDGQRLPRQARRRVDGPRLREARHHAPRSSRT